MVTPSTITEPDMVINDYFYFLWNDGESMDIRVHAIRVRVAYALSQETGERSLGTYRCLETAGAVP